MKKFKFLAMLLLGSLISFGNISCSDDDDDEPAQNIKAVGFNTEKPVKRIVLYDTRDNKIIRTMNYTWSGKNITSVSMSVPVDESGKLLDIMKWDYQYQGKKVICKATERNEDTMEMEDSPMGNPVILLDEDGYAQSYTIDNPHKSIEIYNGGESKKTFCSEVITYKVERDALHRVIKDVRTFQRTFTPEDLAWQGMDQQPQMEVSDNIYAFEDNGDVKGAEYTEYENKNGFFPGMHSYFAFPRNNYHDLPMGPYDFFHIVAPKHLLSRFGHEIYKYEFDADGYVTKVYDGRENFNEIYYNDYAVFEY